MQNPRDQPAVAPPTTDPRGWSASGLDRRSRVPLYYQLQELLHQQIASGRFRVGDALPSEGELCELFGVSRIVVRQALQVLEDDGEIVRQQGRGTFVTEPKLDLIAGGLVRVLSSDGHASHDVEILDAHHTGVEESVAARLGAAEVLRIDWLLRLRGEAMGIAYSFLRPGTATSLQRAAIRGARLGSSAPLTAGLELDHSEVTVSTSQCSPYNAERLGVPPRAPVFLVDVTEIARAVDGPQLEAVEIGRVVYRSDKLSLQLEATTGGGVQQIAARLSGVTGA